MLTREQVQAAQARAAELFGSAGIVLTPHERATIEAAQKATSAVDPFAVNE